MNLAHEIRRLLLQMFTPTAMLFLLVGAFVLAVVAWALSQPHLG